MRLDSCQRPDCRGVDFRVNHADCVQGGVEVTTDLKQTDSFISLKFSKESLCVENRLQGQAEARRQI